MIDGQHEYFGKRELVSPNLVGIFRGKVFVGIATNFVLLMKNSVIKICHTGNTSKLLNGGKAIFKSQMFNLRINDGGGGWVIYQEKELLPPAVLDKAPSSESSHQLSRAVLHPPVLASCGLTGMMI